MTTSLRCSALIGRGSIALSSGFLACVGPDEVVQATRYTFDSSEAAFDASYARSTLSLSGRVLDGAGQPMAGAAVSVIAFGDGAANAGASAMTDGTGVFSLTGLRRRSVLLKISRDGWYPEIVAVDLQRPLEEAATVAPDVVMTARQAGRARLVFVGDTMFGRRFTDADEDGAEGEPGDLIGPDSRSSDAKSIVAFVRDAVSAADFAVANLECAVTNDPDTPHPAKAYTFFSYPATLDGLVDAGFDGVDLANNHVFDYLTAGVFDTLDAVASVGLEWTGADFNETAAADTTIHVEVGGVPLALQGVSALRIDGSEEPKYLLVARDPSKAGALEASDPNLAKFLADEAGVRFAVPMIHGGVEYSSYPDDRMRGLFVESIEQGAGLVVAHHTHTAHGIGLVDPGTGPRFVLMSLGNFIFDESMFETWQSVIAVADVDQLPGGEFEVARVQLIPVHVERYVPKLLAGAWAARMGRHLGHLSTTLPNTASGGGSPDGLTGAVVFPGGHRVVAFRSPWQFTTTTDTEQRSLPVEGGETEAVEFVRLGPSDALAKVQSSAAAQVEVGREILLYGDFEDLDVDGEFHEGSMWQQSDSRYVENSVVRSGIGAAVLLRDASSVGPVEMTNYRDVPVEGGGALTIRGWVRADNGGTFRLRTTTYDGDDDAISTVERHAESAGTYGWTRFSVDFTLPASAVHLRLGLLQEPPDSGEGRVFVDDLAVVQWEATEGDAKAGLSLPTPNGYDFVRFRGVAGPTLDVTLTHRTYVWP
jgi:poly-gamma-glutamate capsule biosynthesis protein CapA/YwtB (metallophosphatase superfamily)